MNIFQNQNLLQEEYVELDLSNYATKADFKNATSVDTSDFTKKTDLVNLKCNVDNLDIDKLKNVPNNLSNLKIRVDELDVDKSVPVSVDLRIQIDVVKNDVIIKDAYNDKIENIEDKIPDITNLATNNTLNAIIDEVKNKIPNITGLATTTALTAVEKKIPNVSNLVKINDYKTKISEIENKITTDYDHDKYMTTQEFHKITWESFAARAAREHLASKSDIANFVKKTYFDDKLKDLYKDVTSNKNELNELS